MSDDKLEQLHAMAAELHAMAGADANQMRNVFAAMTSGGYDYSDTLHNIYLDYGYPAQLQFSNFWNMYRRFGIAENVIELPVDTGWMSWPTIDGSEQFNNELEKLSERTSLMNRLKGLDKRQRVGRYAGMFMRVRDGKQPDQPLEGKLSGEAALMQMIPLYESQLKVIKEDQSPMSETFGQPLILEYNQGAVGDRSEKQNNSINIHASRIVFAAEDADDGSIYGVPAMESVFNSLMDLRKIIGGAGEGFYKNAAQNIVFDLKDGASAMQYKDKLDQFNDQYDEFSRDRFRRGMWTPGMEAKTLESAMISPKDPFNVALNDVAAGSKIPATILIGQQTGRLASDEDSKQFLSTVQSRREGFQTEMTRDVVNWCIQWGVLPSSEYTVEFDDLLARSDDEKLGNAGKMATINKEQFGSGQPAVFTEDEIREAAGYDAEVDIEPGDETIPANEEGE